MKICEYDKWVISESSESPELPYVITYDGQVQAAFRSLQKGFAHVCGNIVTELPMHTRIVVQFYRKGDEGIQEVVSLVNLFGLAQRKGIGVHYVE